MVSVLISGVVNGVRDFAGSPHCDFITVDHLCVRIIIFLSCTDGGCIYQGKSK